MSGGPVADRAAAARPARFDFFGRTISVETDDPTLERRIADTLAVFRGSTVAEPCAAFHIVQRDAESPIEAGQQFNDGSLLVIADRHKLITASLAAPPWQIYIEAFRRSDEYTYYYLFDPLLLMVLKRHGLVHWHGAAVHLGGTDVLIAGEGGAGKSTTTLALLLHGAAFVADDELFLEVAPDGVRARGAERWLHCTDETARLAGLAELEHLPLVPRGRRVKRRLDPSQLPGAARSRRASASQPIGAVLFPRVAADVATALQPLTAADAMRRLLLQRPKEHPAVLPDPASLQQQFAACAGVAAAARCFEAVLGRDLARLPELIERGLR